MNEDVEEASHSGGKHGPLQTLPTNHDISSSDDAVESNGPALPAHYKSSELLSKLKRQRSKESPPLKKRCHRNDSCDYESPKANTSGGKCGPQYPLPNIDIKTKNDPKLKLSIPKKSSPSFFDNRAFTFDDHDDEVTNERLQFRGDSSTPSKPLFIDNDPSLGLPMSSPVPFPPTSRQNSTNSLIRYSERIFDDSRDGTDEHCRILDELDDRILPASPSALSTDSSRSGLQMNVSPSAGNDSDGFITNQAMDTDEDIDKGDIVDIKPCPEAELLQLQLCDLTDNSNSTDQGLPSPSMLMDVPSFPQTPQTAIEADSLSLNLEMPNWQRIDAVNSTDELNSTDEIMSSMKRSDTIPINIAIQESTGRIKVSPAGDSRNREHSELRIEDDVMPSASNLSTFFKRSTSEKNTESLFEEVGVLSRKFSDAHVFVDENDIFECLERHKSSAGRIDIVFNELKERFGTSYGNDLNVLQFEFPRVDSSALRILLDLQKESKTRLTTARLELSKDPSFSADPLYTDVLSLVKIFPERDQLEIYAYLKAKQNEPNRVESVVETLMRSDSNPSPEKPQRSVSEELRVVGGLVDDNLKAEFKKIKTIFPDCESEYIYKQLILYGADDDRSQRVASRMAELRTYPKVKEKKVKVKKKSRFDLKSFVKLFPNAVEYFSDVSRVISENYKNHVLAYLLNYFTSIRKEYIKLCMGNHSNHLTPTFQYIQQRVQEITNASTTANAETVHDQQEVFCEDPRLNVVVYPNSSDELFFKELQFIEHEVEITNYINMVAKEKSRARDAARESGDLMECTCCYNDDILFEEMQACCDGHLFCMECIRMSAETQIGDGKCRFPCLTGSCEAEFSLQVLRLVLRPEVLSKILQRLQEEEVRLAGIENLVACPFCPFATIIDDDQDRVFCCKNPECMKESCRLCRELNHVPLTCEEFKKDDTDMRTFIEKRISEAMIRICHNCKKRYYKQDGCNKMTCSCGATMCYVCQAPSISYDHFESTKCRLYSDTQHQHNEEMDKAGRAAFREYVTLHPEERDKYNPDQLINGIPTTISERGRGYDNDDVEDDNFSDDEEDYDNEDDDIEIDGAADPDRDNPGEYAFLQRAYPDRYDI